MAMKTRNMLALAAIAALSACSDGPPAATAATPAATPKPILAAAPPAPEPMFAVRTPLALDAPLGPGDFAWNPEGLPPGQTTIVVDLLWQLAYVYRDGVEIGRAFINYGADNKPTPTGIFPILEKDADHISNIYDVPMPFMLRLTMDGIAIHGSEVDGRSATAGCVGVPDEFAKLLFAEAKIGDQVLVTRGWARETYGKQASAQA